jgi:hypothetical protein
MNSMIDTSGTLDAQVSFKQIGNVTSKQIGNVTSSPKAFFKKSLKQISETDIFTCDISSSDFDNIFRFEIVEIVGDEFSERIVFKLSYSDTFIVSLELNGYWELDKEPKFQLDNVDWIFEEIRSNPTSAFFLQTFKSILCLSDKIKVEIPKIKYYFECSLPLPLNGISEILQTRQLAYRLMVIEKALNISLPFPKRFITGEEVGNIAFCYHAIIEREFDWAINELTFFPVATKKYIDLLPSTNKTFPLSFPTNNKITIIFGQTINVGQFMVEIPQAIVENYEEARENLNKLNGEAVKVVVKSANGLITNKAITTPKLPKNAFSKEVHKLIDLDSKLDEKALNRYFKLASDTLEGLDEDQIKAITARPKLDEEAFDY